MEVEIVEDEYRVLVCILHEVVKIIPVLRLCGIDEEQIRHDFLLSNEYRKTFIEKRLNSMNLLQRLSDNIRTAIMAVEGVLPEEVHMILAEILERYGTYERFFFYEYGLTENDLQKLRDYYLE